MTDIVAFLNARLAEDESAANAAAFGEPERQGWKYAWSADREDYRFWRIHTTKAPHVEVAGCGMDGSGGIHDEAVADHIARHDPARVLAEVAAKRALLKRLDEATDACTDDAEWSGASTAEWQVLVHLAAPFADHPDYDPAWRVAPC